MLKRSSAVGCFMAALTVVALAGCDRRPSPEVPTPPRTDASTAPETTPVTPPSTPASPASATP